MISFFKYIGLVFIVALFASRTAVFAMQRGADDEIPPHAQTTAAPSTPVTASAAALTASEETPALFLSRRQARILQAVAFERVIGPERVAESGIVWEVFQDPTSPYTSEKLLNLHRVCTMMRKLVSEFQRNDDFQDLYAHVFGLKDQLEAIHLKRLKGVVSKYFSAQFPGSEITFETKEVGVQLGSIVKVREPGGREHRFYVKTHSEGKRASKSSAAKVVDPNELLVYKILESLGLGCEVHFCARSPEDVYIATRSAAEGGPFFPFKQILEGGQSLGASLWGRLGRMNDSPQENDWKAVERDVASDPLAQQFADQVVTIDILTRLLRLGDLLKNTDNFGFSRPHSADSPWGLRILDFRLLEDTRLKFTEEHFGGFLEGNGLFRYDLADKTVSYLLHYRDEVRRVQTALSVMAAGSLQNLETSIEGAYAFVEAYIQGDRSFEARRGALLGRLATYRECVLANCAFFRERLEPYRSETQEAAGEELSTGSSPTHTIEGT